MFSEYASKYLSKSQRPAPLFNGGAQGDSDVDDYLEAVSGSTDDDSYNSDSDSESMQSTSDSMNTARQTETNSPDPPSELLTERPKKTDYPRKKQKRKEGYSLWKQNVKTWAKASSLPSTSNNGHGPKPGRTSSNPISDGATDDSNELQNAWEDTEAGVAHRKPFDNTVAAFYLVALSLSLATGGLVVVTSSSNESNRVYLIFAYSAKSLAIYTVLACAIASAWLFCIRTFTRAVVQTSVFGVPLTLSAISLGSLLMSIHHTTLRWHGLSHALIRVVCLVPLAIALLWILYLRRVKDVMGRAADIVVKSAEVYNNCAPSMIGLTIFSGVSSIIITGVWSLFLAKAFLEGNMSILLVIWFSFMYLWSWSIFCSLLHAVLTIQTTIWYSRDFSSGQDPIKGAMGTSIYRAVTFHFSSACLSGFIAILVKGPLLILPKQISSIVAGTASIVLNTSASRLLNPLTLPISVLRRCSLSSAANMIGSSKFENIDFRAYRLAKLFLVAGRLWCSILFGFIAWIHADRVQDVSSVHGYWIGIVALFIGWTIMGSTESVLGMICDALVVNCALQTESPKHEELKRLFAIGPEEHGEPASHTEEQFSD